MPSPGPFETSVSEVGQDFFVPGPEAVAGYSNVQHDRIAAQRRIGQDPIGMITQSTGDPATRAPRRNRFEVARIRKIEQGTQTVNAHTTEVDCFYQIVTAPGGERLLHLSTFGSDARASKPKSSQSIQLDRDAAQELMAVLIRAFPGL